MGYVFGMWPNAAQQAKHRLNQKRRFDKAALDEVGSGVEVANVVTLDLKSGAVVFAGFKNMGNVDSAKS